MRLSVAELSLAILLPITIAGVIVGGSYIIVTLIAGPKKILRKLKYLSERSASNGCITVFDLATAAAISPNKAKKVLEKYCRELEGEKLVSAKGEIYYLFPRGEKIDRREIQLTPESAIDSRIKLLEEKNDQLAKNRLKANN